MSQNAADVGISSADSRLAPWMRHSPGSVVASGVPARRAAAIEPAVALKQD